MSKRELYTHFQTSQLLIQLEYEVMAIKEPVFHGRKTKKGCPVCHRTQHSSRPGPCSVIFTKLLKLPGNSRETGCFGTLPDAQVRETEWQRYGTLNPGQVSNVLWIIFPTHKLKFINLASFSLYSGSALLLILDTTKLDNSAGILTSIHQGAHSEVMT